MRWLRSLTPVTYLSKLLGIQSLAAFLQLELFRVYTTKMRGAMPGGSVLLTMDTYLSPMVVNYCSSRQGEIISVWCVDKNNYPLFKVKYSGPSDVPLMVNGKMTMFTPYPLLEIIERNNTISDQEWLTSAKTRWGFSPDTLTESH
ncbi:hypothetical protein [Candidatus Symbiopectobacterium sp. NZEC135]|uniref:hypothetical protein n=1 Tax=Candidatus Symbiopectobacterium sp. NZEC135 TaxID=2820471 RepID=UPI0022268E17|nr:hypothetical protein [Candidatus Symbiopectobacterium sp. NZEC135]MCW2479277.1 hypothetical protein [Candidatus Symbiopectobacterium sp. NZEC135]